MISATGLWRGAFLGVIALITVSGTALARPEFSAVAVDARTGTILYEDDIDSERHPASLTKMMTLYVLFQEMKAGRISKNTEFKVSARASRMPPSSLHLRAGTTITAEDAIMALVTKSANDVAATIAENLAGSESDFAERMTKTARSMGMKHTYFNNASGLPNDGQVTTARDMATLGLRLMRDFPQYYPYFRIESFEFNGREINTHNTLVKTYPGTDGIKTGYIASSGYNLVTSTRQGRKRLVGVVLGARSVFGRTRFMRQMLEDNFAKAKDGDTIAALAGSSEGVINPIAISPKKSQVGENTDKLGLAAVSAAAAVDGGNSDKSSIESKGPRVVEAHLATTGKTVITSVSDRAPSLINNLGETWNIQVGSYASKNQADAKLTMLQKNLPNLLSDKQGYTLKANNDGETVFRVRFAGFYGSDEAKQVCSKLLKAGATCVTIAPQS